MSLAEHDDIRVRYQLALTLGESNDERFADALLAVATRDPEDVWIRTAVLTSAASHALPMLTRLLEDREQIDQHRELLEGLIATALGNEVNQTAPQLARVIAGSLPDAEVQPWQPAALASYLDALERRGSSWEDVLQADEADADSLAAAVEPIFATSRATANHVDTPLEERAGALLLLGHEPVYRNQDVELLMWLLLPQTPVELQTGRLSASWLADSTTNYRPCCW